MDELVRNLKTYKMKKKKYNERRETKREKNLVLKIDINDSGGEDGKMAYLTRRFQKMIEHFIKDCPLLKQDHYNKNFDKVAKRNLDPNKCFNGKYDTDIVVKQDLASWGDSSSESEKENEHGGSSMMAVENEATEYDSIFALMDQFDDDEDDDDDELMSLANVLIDAYHSLINDKNALTMELEEDEQTRGDLVVVVVDLKETIEKLKNEKDALDKKIASIEHERDDLMVVMVDLKETIECVSKEKETLTEIVVIIEQERDHLAVVVVDLKETIEELKMESRPGNSKKGTEVASEAHIKLENELNLEELGKVKSDLEKSLKWTWSSDAITATHVNNRGNKQGIGFQREKTPYNPHSKAIGDNAKLWDRRLEHASFSLLNKLVQKDLVRGLPKSSFKEHKVCDACAKGKHVRSSFKPKKIVSTSSPLDLLHMDLCGLMREQNRRGRRHIL
ncbi:uncharacterized protein [Nicotiana sylvestris]|uniref:uncharacterized protein n=1 Tax=Nicotiana sylvestris TaxID=4096 RepID=UPI00388C3D95